MFVRLSSRALDCTQAGPETSCPGSPSSLARPIAEGSCVIGVPIATAETSASGNPRLCALVHSCASAPLRLRTRHLLPHEAISLMENDQCYFANKETTETAGTLAGYGQSLA